MNASDLKKLLNLEPLPGEGGWFRQTYRSQADMVGNEKPLATAIYYLLTDEPDSFSALHRLPGDEIYHFYLGDPLEMLLLYPDGKAMTVTLGPDLAGGQQLQYVIPGGVWQGSRVQPGGRFSLVGTSMAPGFVPADFEAGDREELCRRYPSAADFILLLTRMEKPQ